MRIVKADNCSECPFHAWRTNPNGAFGLGCALLPGEPATKQGERLSNCPIASGGAILVTDGRGVESLERNGMLFA